MILTPSGPLAGGIDPALEGDEILRISKDAK